MNKENFDPLLKIGLSITEARVYLSLVELGESKTGPLCDKSKVHSSKIYSVLESLIQKGFVSYRIQNNVKIFIASSPNILKNLFEEKEKKLNEEKKDMLNLINTLKNTQNKPLSYSLYRYYEGISGIRSLWLELTEELNNISKGEEILIYTGKREAYEGLLGLYEEFHKLRVKKGIKYKVVYPFEEKNTKLSRRRKRQLAEVRFTNLTNEAEFSIVGDKLIIQYITQRTPRAFMIQDKIFVQTFIQIFYKLWQSSKS